MSILFLDFDGVLNSEEFAIRTKVQGIVGLDREAVARLNRVVAATECNIVISSSWRIGRQLSELTRTLVNAGFEDIQHLIGMTPQIEQVVKNGNYASGYAVKHCRGLEVLAWWRQHEFIEQFEKWCCVDDDNDFLPDQPLVQTSWKSGLQDEHVEELIRRLK